MERRLEKIEQSLDDTVEHLTSIDKTLAQQSLILAHHVKRSDMLEKQIEPVHAMMLEMKGVVKIFKYIGVLATILECWHTFRH
jgi:predicted metallo-beta-lactamase superfamily hydrolase